MSGKAVWYRIALGILPDNGVEIDAVMEGKIIRAIGAVVGPWSMIYGFECAPIPIDKLEYPMVSKPGPCFTAKDTPSHDG